MAVGDSGTILTAKADPVGVAFQTKAKPNISSLKILNTKNHISAMLPNEISFSQLKVGLLMFQANEFIQPYPKREMEF